MTPSPCYWPFLIIQSTADSGAVFSFSLSAEARALAVNLLLAGVVVALVAAVRRWRRRRPDADTATKLQAVLEPAAASLGVAAGVWTTSMLAVALIGLLVGRPAGRLLKAATLTALYLAAVALGVVLAGLTGGTHEILTGAILGLLTYASQTVAAALLTFGLPAADRVHLALAQQNGITAILLALAIGAIYPAAAVTVAVAILTVFVLQTAANTTLDLCTT
jgi:hypothetical protein